jgi:hypothetical protein
LKKKKGAGNIYSKLRPARTHLQVRNGRKQKHSTNYLKRFSQLFSLNAFHHLRGDKRAKGVADDDDFLVRFRSIGSSAGGALP